MPERAVLGDRQRRVAPEGTRAQAAELSDHDDSSWSGPATHALSPLISETDLKTHAETRRHV